MLGRLFYRTEIYPNCYSILVMEIAQQWRELSEHACDKLQEVAKINHYVLDGVLNFPDTTPFCILIHNPMAFCECGCPEMLVLVLTL